jgi:Trehalose receptor
MWTEHEKIFLVAPYSNKVKGNYALKIHLIAVLVVFLALLDHYVYFISAVEKTEIEIKDCDETKRDFWKIFYVNERQVFFTVFPFKHWQIPFLEWYEVCLFV